MSSVSLGSLSAPSGVFALGSTDLFDVSWQNRGHENYVVDFIGEGSKAFADAEVVNKCRIEQLSDGTWRVHAGNSTSAEMIADAARTRIRREGLPIRINVGSTSNSRVMCLDASRKNGIGQWSTTNPCIAIKGTTLRVEAETDDTGKVTRIILTPTG